MEKIGLGDRAREKFTGVEGIVTGITLWLTGCNHIAIKREGLDKDGKPWELLWFDEPNVELVKAKEVAEQPADPSTGRKPGGPIPNGR
ncbi:hypothetical protein [Rhizorhabdus sp.]|uniref:hypothetical protein n=1 Tax=Rhizorhabdus sp. TaxID=1968843 RepID=UPI0019A13116|nr:hypothetical protein [Rhizorhabdus sp.]MBD3762618.1 hypothetical protein [Rhizorhabdus sp.]